MLFGPGRIPLTLVLRVRVSHHGRRVGVPQDWSGAMPRRYEPIGWSGEWSMASTMSGLCWSMSGTSVRPHRRVAASMRGLRARPWAAHGDVLASLLEEQAEDE